MSALKQKIIVPIIFASVTTAALYAVAADSIDHTVFGVELGKPLTVAECPRSTNFTTGYDHFLAKREGICAERKASYKTGWGATEINVYFPLAESPNFVKHGQFGVGTIEGNVENIVFSTSGLNMQDVVLEKLKEKYGSPTRLENFQVKNRMNATFQTFKATWIFSDFVVTFKGVTDTLDDGEVEASTLTYLRVYNSWLEKKQQSEPKL
jgi:hypothetical protein